MGKMNDIGQGPFEVFVYGSLMRGLHNHPLLTHSTFLGEALTEAAFELYSLGYFPAMTRGGCCAVRGECFEVDAETLHALDRLEGHPEFYRRQRISLGDGRRVLSYLVEPRQVAGRPHVDKGCWRSFLQRRQEQLR